MRVEDTPLTQPKAKIPMVELPAAEPQRDAAEDAVADALVSPEYVYLFRVVEPEVAEAHVAPKAKIPTVELPAAEPWAEIDAEDVPEELTAVAYVYLSRVAIEVGVLPNANIPTVEFPAADPINDAVDAAVAIAFEQLA